MQLGPQLLVVLLEVLHVGDGGAVRLAEGAVLALQLVLLLGHPVVVVLQLPQLPLQPPGLLLAVVLGQELLTTGSPLVCRQRGSRIDIKYSHAC